MNIDREKELYSRIEGLRSIIEGLYNEVDELKAGACRQNCRSAKENWMQGYIEAQHNAARVVTLDAQEAWKDVRKGQQETAAKDKRG